jgi:hypothetical protein
MCSYRPTAVSVPQRVTFIKTVQGLLKPFETSGNVTPTAHRHIPADANIPVIFQAN